MANQANSAAYRLGDGRMAVNVDSNKTLALADAGYVQNVIAADVVVTLPATAVVGTFNIRNGGAPASSALGAASGASGIKISVTPNASDKVSGGVDGTATDGKPFENTAATSKVGDEISITNTGATDGGFVNYVKGTWVRNNA